MTFGLSVLPLATLLGTAIDYSRAHSLKSLLQARADQIALLSFDLPAETRLGSAESALMTLGDTFDSVAITQAEQTIRVTASGQVKTAVLGLVGIERIPVAVEAVAAAADKGLPICLLALNRTKAKALSFSGSSAFVGRECAVHSNSAAADGLDVSGSARPVANEFCSSGGASAPPDLAPQPKVNCKPRRDPFAGKVKPPPSDGCTYHNVQIRPNRSATLDPGVYCGGLTIQGSASLVSGGVYVIKDGELRVNSGASLRGENVLLYLTGSGAGFTINGGGAVHLSAARSGSHGGILIYHDPAANPGTENTLNGGSDTIINGAIYTPAQAIKLNGSSGFGQSSAYMPVIADTISITGNTDMAIDLAGITPPAPFPETGTMVRLIK